MGALKLADCCIYLYIAGNFCILYAQVMKEEMMTMKAAFETKLRLAREEADQTSKVQYPHCYSLSPVLRVN